MLKTVEIKVHIDARQGYYVAELEDPEGKNAPIELGRVLAGAHDASENVRNAFHLMIAGVLNDATESARPSSATFSVEGHASTPADCVIKMDHYGRCSKGTLGCIEAHKAKQ